MSITQVFGYPQFDDGGEMPLTQYDGPYRDMQMDICVYRLEREQKLRLHRLDEEMVVLLLQGQVTFVWEGKSKTALRADVFNASPWALHVSKDSPVVVQAVGHSELLVAFTRNNKAFVSRLYSPTDAPWLDNKLGDITASRHNTIFDHKASPNSNIALSEVIIEPGSWASYPPHQHQHPEVNFYLFNRPEGFGATFLDDEVCKVKHYSFAAIPPGTAHPQVSAPGYSMYSCCIWHHLDGRPRAEPTYDERYIWTQD